MRAHFPCDKYGRLLYKISISGTSGNKNNFLYVSGEELNVLVMMQISYE